MPKIIVLDDLSPEGLALLDAAEGIAYDIRTGLKGDELRAALAEYDGAILRSGVQITAASLEGNRRLKAIVRAGVGTDNIDKQAATRLGIVVMNTPDGNTVSTAEHAFALMLALSRNVAPAFEALKANKFKEARKKYIGTQLADKTLGIIGVGRIGQEIAKRAKAFQMRVMGYDPFLSPERAREIGVELVGSVKELLPHVDYLTVHTHLTPETENMIDLAALELLKPGARLINAARGGIYNEAALVEGLKSGKLGGVALDVYPKEPPPPDNPLFTMDNVVCTPHLGASTEEAQTQVAVEGCQLLINFLKTGEIRHAVNAGALDPKTLLALRGFLNLTYRLGLLAAQLQRGPVKSCRITYRGEVAERNTKLLSSAFCAGLLTRAMPEEVNIVNAELLLRERGIELVAESNPDRGAFSSSIKATVVGEKESSTVAGTLFGNDMPRLIRVDDFRLEAYLDGVLMFFHHDDVPGIIGSVGTIFGKHQVNIAQMSVGRSGEVPGGPAIGVLNLDGQPPTAALNEVLAHPHIQTANVVELPKAGELPPWLA
jgi:D-3-phosphoglycerate dehydrogenase